MQNTTAARSLPGSLEQVAVEPCAPSASRQAPVPAVHRIAQGSSHPLVHAHADNSRVSQERSSALSKARRTQALLMALRERDATAPVPPEDARQASNGLSPDEHELMRRHLDAEWRDTQAQLARLVEVKAYIAQAEHTLAAWRTEALKTLSQRHAKADLQARSIQAEGTKTSQRKQLTTLRAPVSGTGHSRSDAGEQGRGVWGRKRPSSSRLSPSRAMARFRPKSPPSRLMRR